MSSVMTEPETLNVGTVNCSGQHNTSLKMHFDSCIFPGVLSDTGAGKEELLRVYIAVNLSVNIKGKTRLFCANTKE